MVRTRLGPLILGSHAGTLPDSLLSRLTDFWVLDFASSLRRKLFGMLWAGAEGLNVSRENIRTCRIEVMMGLIRSR